MTATTTRTVEDAAVEKYRSIAQRAFDDARTSGIAAVRLALQNSMVDGPNDKRNQALAQLEPAANANAGWRAIVRPS